MLNIITLMGRLTAHPELKYTTSQKPVVSFTLAVERDFQDEHGQRQSDFVSCVAWGSTAEFISRYFSKGQLMVLNGRLQSRKWQDRSGAKRVQWEVVTDNVYFSGEKKKEAQPQTICGSINPAQFWNLDEDDSELPF